MKTTVNEYDFRRAFETLRPENFSYEGLGLLFEYLEQYEEDTGEEIELDVIALCCDYCESDIDTIAQDYQIDLSDFDPEVDDDEVKRDIVMEHLLCHTAVVGETSEGNIVYLAF